MKLEDILVRRALSKLGCYCMDCVSNYCKWKNIPAPVYVRREATFFEEEAVVACPCDECLGGYAGKGIQVMKFEKDISCSGPGCYDCLAYENLCLREEMRLDKLKEELENNDKVEELERELRIERNTVSRISAELKEELENVPTVYNFGSNQASDEHCTIFTWPAYKNRGSEPLWHLHNTKSGKDKYECFKYRSFDQQHKIDVVANYMSNKHNLSIVSIKCKYPRYDSDYRHTQPCMSFEIIMVPGPKIFLRTNGSASRIFRVVTDMPRMQINRSYIGIHEFTTGKRDLPEQTDNDDTHKIDNFYRYPWPAEDS